MIATVMRAALEALERGEAFALVSVIEAEGSSPGKPGHKMLLYGDGRQEGTIGGGQLELKVKEEALSMIRRGSGGLLSYSFEPGAHDSIGLMCGGRATLAVEVMAPPARILLCGGGHVAQAVARLCREVEFAYAVVDPREEIVSAERFPDAAARMAQSPDAFISDGGLHGFDHVIVLTHEHALDRKVMLAIAQTDFAGYLGLIGSRRKWGKIREALSEAGSTPEWIARVHCPVGLAIGAHTPAEIALSIVAEIIKEKNADASQ